MEQSVDFSKLAPDAIRLFAQLGEAAKKSGLEENILALIELRASQINHCAFCLVLHTLQAEALGEDSKKIASVAGWREAHWFSVRERAALEWTEDLTLVADHRPSDDLLARMREVFSDKELVYLTLAVTTINSYNRFNVAFRTPAEAAEPLFKQLQRQRQMAHA
jgi:AhpD family alkylhydroperoxidase